MNPAELGLYIHVPFCRQKCSWCAFASEEGALGVEPWLDRILSQLVAPPDPRALWATAYLGGGTPSLLTPDQLDRLLAGVQTRLVPGAEVTMEANPESLTSEHLSVLAARGGTRLSLGIQTFQEEILARHGRPTRLRHLDEARKLVDSWEGSLSLDLICGLGGQTELGQRSDLEMALGWDPDHISFYSLTLENGTPLAQGVFAGTVALPDDDMATSWWLKGRDFLEDSGFPAYEVSNFARPGAESVHNGRYWALEPWWGIGPSATSFLRPKAGRPEYRHEVSQLGSWLGGASPEIEVPTALELAKDTLLAGLRRTRGVEAFPWTDLIPRSLEAWRGRALVASGRLFLSREAFPFLDAFLREAFAELDGRSEFR